MKPFATRSFIAVAARDPLALSAQDALPRPTGCEVTKRVITLTLDSLWGANDLQTGAITISARPAS